MHRQRHPVRRAVHKAATQSASAEWWVRSHQDEQIEGAEEKENEGETEGKEDFVKLSGQQIEEIIPDTVNDMRSFGLKRIVPAHCTGWRAVGALVKAFGEEVIVPSAVGRQFVF